MLETTSNFVQPDFLASSKLPVKKKSFFSNFKFDLLLSPKHKGSNVKLLKSQSIFTRNDIVPSIAYDYDDIITSSSPLKQRHQMYHQQNSTSSSTSKKSFNFFENIKIINPDNSDLLKSRINSPFYLRKSYSEAYKYNPFILSTCSSNELDQISRISSSTSSTTIPTDSGLSSVDSTQLLCAELKDCLGKGESYNNIEIKFRKNLYAFWCLDEYGNSIFHLAAKYGSLDVLRSLVLKYPNKWYVTNKLGETAMQSAIDSNNIESFKYLLQLKLDENVDISQIVDHEGNSLLCKAILYNQYDFVKHMIEYYPNLINIKNSYGCYPVHLSALKGNMQIFRLVCRESKKYINERDSKSLTPSMYATQQGHYECLKYLLDNLNAKYNKTVKSNKYTLLHLGVRSGSLDVVQYLIMKMGASFLKCRTKEGATVFHLASASGNHEILEYLLATKLAKSLKGLKDLMGSTAAHDAAENGHYKCLKLLYDAGLNMFEEDIEHATPYSLALKSSSEESKEFVSSLKPPSISNNNNIFEPNANNTLNKFNLRRLSSMIRQRRAKPVNGTPPYLYTQKLRPAPVSLPHTSSSITGIQNSVINRHEFNEDEFNDSAIDAILNEISNNARKSSVITRVENEAYMQANNLEDDSSNSSASRMSRYQEYQKMQKNLSSSRESTPTQQIQTSRSGTPTPLLHSIKNELEFGKSEQQFNPKLNTASIIVNNNHNNDKSSRSKNEILAKSLSLDTTNNNHNNCNNNDNSEKSTKQLRFYKISRKDITKPTTINIQNINYIQEEVKSDVEYNNQSDAWKLLNRKKSVAFEDEVNTKTSDIGKNKNNNSKRNYHRSESLPETYHYEIRDKVINNTKSNKHRSLKAEKKKIVSQSSLDTRNRDTSPSSMEDKFHDHKQFINNNNNNNSSNQKNSCSIYIGKGQNYEPAPDYWDSDNIKNNKNTNGHVKESYKKNKTSLVVQPSSILESISTNSFQFPSPPTSIQLKQNNLNNLQMKDSSPPTSTNSSRVDKQISEPISLAQLISKNLPTSNNSEDFNNEKALNREIEAYYINNLNKTSPLVSSNENNNEQNNKSFSSKVTNFEQLTKETPVTSKSSNSPSSLNNTNKQSQMFNESSKRSSSNHSVKMLNYSTNIYVNVNDNIIENNNLVDDNNNITNIYSNISNNLNDNIYIANVKVYNDYSNTNTTTTTTNNYNNNQIGIHLKRLDILSDEEQYFPTPPMQNLNKISNYDTTDFRTPSPNWPPPPPIPSILTNGENNSNSKLDITSESLIEAKKKIFMKKHNTEKPIDDSKPTSINVNNNERGRIADSLLKEMQKHKLYNTQKDYILNYLDRNNNPKESINNAPRINSSFLNGDQENQNDSKQVKIYEETNHVAIINTEIEKTIQSKTLNKILNDQRKNNASLTYDRFPYLRTKTQTKPNISKSIQNNETNKIIENFNNSISLNKNNNHETSVSSYSSNSSGSSKINGFNNSLSITVINNDVSIKKNRKFELMNSNNSNNESELDRVFKRRALQNQIQE